MQIAGENTWRIKLYTKPGFSDDLGAAQTWIIGISGLLVDLAIFVAFLSIARSHRVAVKKYDEFSRKLKEAQARLELALGSAKMGVWERDLQTGNLIWDERVAKMFGAEEAGEVSRAQDESLKRFHPDDRDAVLANDARAITEDEPITQVCHRLFKMMDQMPYQVDNDSDEKCIGCRREAYWPQL